MNARKLFGLIGLIVLVTLALVSVANAQGPTPRAPRAALGTAITYQGQLKQGGGAYTGTCNMQFSLFDAASSGTQIGTTKTVSGVNVTNGLFTTPIDFGAGAFDGNKRFLQIAVECGSDSSYTPLTPLQELTPAPMALALPGLYTQQNGTNPPNVIGGYSGNTVDSGSNGATICGGGDNGYINHVANFATIGGGRGNQATGGLSTIGGGEMNTANTGQATVGGGTLNTAGGVYATVGGGRSNTASGAGAFVAGGGYDGIFVAGNKAQGAASTISGGIGNTVTSGATYATVGGGHWNTAKGSFSMVGGGAGNNANADDAMVGGGVGNIAGGTTATVGGGMYNTAGGAGAFVGGGGYDGTNFGGNKAQAPASVISGGISNTVTSGGNYGTIGGGYWNSASNFYATIGGGNSNSASSQSTTVGGGWVNTASGNAATVPGGANNEASGAYSFAAGADGHATHAGSFVWSSAERTDSWGDQTFTVRAHGGVRFYSASGTGTGVVLSSGGGSFSNLSDRSAKASILPVDKRAILAQVVALPVQTWNYKTQDASIRHIGPMAQDFYAAFKVGEDDTHITTIDADGVALAAIQGLYQVVQDKDAKIAAQQKQIDDLNARLTALENGTVAAQSPFAGLTNNAWFIGAMFVAVVWVGRNRRGAAP